MELNKRGLADTPEFVLALQHSVESERADNGKREERNVPRLSLLTISVTA